MARVLAVTLDEILIAINDVRSASHGLTFVEFEQARIARLATERAIEIISEAARHLPDDLTGRYPQLPWRKITAIGNILRHEYYHISAKVIWDVVRLELDPLEAVIKHERDQLGPLGTH